MPDPDLAALLAFFKAMANESRLRIVGLLAEHERSVQELAVLLDLKEPTVSHHLTTLKRLGLVSARAEGVTHWHVLRHETLARLNRALVDREGVVALTREVSSDPRLGGGWEAKVLGAAVDSRGALKAIPASRRKRQIVLRWLAQDFEQGRRYSEAEVDKILARRHADVATLRRELVGCGVLARETGGYRCCPPSNGHAHR
jgi:hypothetical protein